MNFEQLNLLVRDWAEVRGIYAHSNARAQLLKAMAEFGELADAEGKEDMAGIIDGIGDTLVCLINYAAMHKLDIVGCLECAYDQIKNRKGYMIQGGLFIKEE